VKLDWFSYFDVATLCAKQHDSGMIKWQLRRRELRLWSDTSRAPATQLPG